MFDMRDEYVTSHVRRVGCGFAFVWVVVTTLGGFAGQFLGQSLTTTLLPEFPNYWGALPVLVLAGAVLGACVGVAQGIALVRYIGLMGFRDWVLASMGAGVLRWAILLPLAAAWVPNMNTGIIQCNVLIPMIVFGAISGAAFGVPQAIVLDRHLERELDLGRWAWALANAGGSVFYLPLVTLSGLTGSALIAMSGTVTQEHFWAAMLAMTFNWLVVGIITTIPLLDRLRQAKYEKYVEEMKW